MKEYVSFFRPELDGMQGYVPGEQPKISGLIKLNTNENPYPPAPGVVQALKKFDPARLRLYPDPLATNLRAELAAMHGISYENVIVGNGSDDILNIAIRCFCDEKRAMAMVYPSYSLYKTLCELQGCECISIPLNEEDFSLPDNFLEQAERANLLILTRPNAPTGNSFPKEKVSEICEKFHGIVLIDEAYADFASDNCAEFATRYSNVIVARTFSKSRNLAGLRLGYAFACKEIIDGMMKMKDSYNVSMLSQTLAVASIWDHAYFRDCVARIKVCRETLYHRLCGLGFKVIDSETNFLFASPPDGDAETYFRKLRENKFLVRYFPGGMTGKYVRISIGTDEDMKAFYEFTKSLYR